MSTSLISNQARELDENIRSGRITPELLNKLLEHPERVLMTYWKERQIGVIPKNVAPLDVSHGQRTANGVIFGCLATRRGPTGVYKTPQIIEDRKVQREFPDIKIVAHSTRESVRWEAISYYRGSIRFAISRHDHDQHARYLHTEHGELKVEGDVRHAQFTETGLLYALEHGNFWNIRHGHTVYNGMYHLHFLTTDGQDVTATAVNEEGNHVVIVNGAVAVTNRKSAHSLLFGHMAGNVVAYAVRSSDAKTTLRWGDRAWETDRSISAFRMVNELPLTQSDQGVYHSTERLSSSYLELRNAHSYGHGVWDARNTPLFLTGKHEGSQHGTLRMHLGYDRSPVFDDIFEPEITDHEVRVVARRGRDLFLLTHPL